MKEDWMKEDWMKEAWMKATKSSERLYDHVAGGFGKPEHVVHTRNWQ